MNQFCGCPLSSHFCFKRADLPLHDKRAKVAGWPGIIVVVVEKSNSLSILAKFI